MDNILSTTSRFCPLEPIWSSPFLSIILETWNLGLFLQDSSLKTCWLPLLKPNFCPKLVDYQFEFPNQNFKKKTLCVASLFFIPWGIFFSNFNFWATLFSKIMPNFWRTGTHWLFFGNFGSEIQIVINNFGAKIGF